MKEEADKEYIGENIKLVEKRLPNEKDIDNIINNEPPHDDTTCGIWFCKGRLLQKFANKKTYVLLYGLLGCIFNACSSYFNGTLTTIEKRYKIPSRVTGIITSSHDISMMISSLFLCYYAGRGHRPRWLAFGMSTVVLYCILTTLPQILYGSGEDANSLTTEYGATYENNTTFEVMKKHQSQTLCQSKNSTQCDVAEGNLAPQIIFLCAQFISGIGGTLYFTIGVSYMDDNIKKSKTPALISFAYFLRMLGPAIGYALASFCLKYYISPSLTPTITNSDPQWLGAWWLGWAILGIPLLIGTLLLCLFPKELPRAHARKKIQMQISKENGEVMPAELQTSIKDMMISIKRLVSNKIFMVNNLASVFYVFGYIPYWMFMPKYIEIQYRQTASFSSLITGTVGLVFSAFGILISGLLISKCKPRARYLAAWNVIVGILTVCGMISYTYLGCIENDNNSPLQQSGELQVNFECNSNCSCDYVKYSPVCSETGQTFISACHAGCKNSQTMPNGSKIYMDCSCINISPLESVNSHTDKFSKYTNETLDYLAPRKFGRAFQGSCPVDCVNKLYVFLAMVCFLQFSGATARASNMLVSIRCVEEKDKTMSMGLNMMMMSLFAFMPSPIIFGIILDNTCLVWGKTCSGTGNCWLYNGEMLRYNMNLIAAGFFIIGTMFDLIVWYYAKGLKIFDDKVKLENEDKKESAVIF